MEENKHSGATRRFRDRVRTDLRLDGCGQRTRCGNKRKDDLKEERGADGAATVGLGVILATLYGN